MKPAFDFDAYVIKSATDCGVPKRLKSKGALSAVVSLIKRPSI
jgi:hypothetical protein